MAGASVLRASSRLACGLFVAILAAGGSPPAAAQTERQAGPLTQPAGGYREQEFLIPWPRDDKRTFLAQVKIFRPQTEEPRPLVLIGHGAPRRPSDRPLMSPGWADGPARWFVAQGLVVVVAMRRGYGQSDGPVFEGLKGGDDAECGDPDYWNAGISTVYDYQGVLGYMAQQPYVDPQRIAVVGLSAGGWGSLALETHPPGVEPPVKPRIRAVVAFAPGRGSYAAGLVCKPDRLVAAAKRFGETATIPSLWMYATTDKYFQPPFARQLFAAYTAGGAPAEFQLINSYDDDGHGVFESTMSMNSWQPIVHDYLKKQGLLD